MHAPTSTPNPEMIARCGVRWHIEEDNEQNKQAVGLDSYQVRKWDPWHRHVTSYMLAHAFLAVQRAQYTAPADPVEAFTPGKDQLTRESEAAG